jgi:hypothetical protein
VSLCLCDRNTFFQGSQLFGFEFKWGAGKMKKATWQEFLTAYPNSKLEVISRDNFVEFLR